MASCTPHNNPRFFSWPLWGWITLFLAITAIMQSYIPFPLDNDSPYHFAVAQLIRKYGILQSFPWTPFSLQADHYADKEFLFHLLFIPFINFGMINASRIVGVISGTLVLTALYGILRQQGVRNAGIWALVPLGTGYFLFRLFMVRPHLLSITLALLLLWAYMNGRQPLLLLAAILYPLSYVAFWQLPVILVIAAETAHFLSSEKPQVKLLLTVVTGLVIGLVLHPNSWNLVSISWLHMSDILLQSAWSSGAKVPRLGELLPPGGMEWLLSLSFNVLLTITALVIIWRDRKNNAGTVAFAVTALVFGLLTALSMRFTEYFVPFSVAALALACRKYESRLIAPALLAGVMAAGSLYILPMYVSVMVSLDNKDARIDQREAALMAEAVPAGAQVFTCNMDYTGNLMVALPERYFIVAADPLLFYKKDPALYDIWMMLPRAQNAAEVIRAHFRSRYVVCKDDQRYEALFDNLSSEPGVTAIKTDRWTIFDLGEGEP